jgi:hypothetical protein
LQALLLNSGSLMCVEVRMYVVKVEFKKSLADGADRGSDKGIGW